MCYELYGLISILLLIGCTLEDRGINSMSEDSSFVNQQVFNDSLVVNEIAPSCELPVEISPVYKNGTNEQLQQLLRQQLVYPNELCLRGTTVVCFIVDKKGIVIKPEIKRSLAVEIDSQLVHLIKQYEFVPGKLNGEVAAFQMYFPIRIELE